MACPDHPCAVFEIASRPGIVLFSVAAQYARERGEDLRVARLWHVFDWMRAAPRTCQLCGEPQDEEAARLFPSGAT